MFAKSKKEEEEEEEEDCGKGSYKNPYGVKTIRSECCTLHMISQIFRIILINNINRKK
jgi:hypothetical protein